MGELARTRAVTVWVIAALLIGFAPLFHAICIAPTAASASGEGMVHTMADGTVMSSASFTTDERSADAAASPHAAAASIDGFAELPATVIGPMSEVLPSIGDLGMILVVVGLAVLSVILFVRRREIVRSFGRPPPPASLARALPVVAVGPRAAVDLDALGISRT